LAPLSFEQLKPAFAHATFLAQPGKGLTVLLPDFLGFPRKHADSLLRQSLEEQTALIQWQLGKSTDADLHQYEVAGALLREEAKVLTLMLPHTMVEAMEELTHALGVTLQHLGFFPLLFTESEARFGRGSLGLVFSDHAVFLHPFGNGLGRYRQRKLPKLETGVDWHTFLETDAIHASSLPMTLLVASKTHRECLRPLMNHQPHIRLHDEPNLALALKQMAMLP
jgi:hypothetical protein